MTYLFLLALPLVLVGYSYLGYPMALWLLGRGRRASDHGSENDPWPALTITIPAYNEAETIGATLEALLRVDYPADRRHILVISDASTDATDAIVREYASRGVTLLRVPTRAGKSAAENLAATALTGEIVVNIDATVGIPPGSLLPLIRAFRDPGVGVASGRDVSVSVVKTEGNLGESGYVGYEMWVRALETRCGGIVGASGCFYAIRRPLYDSAFPPRLSRDFANCLLARRAGFRAVSVDDAVCQVPRASSLRAEYHRKVRTMSRGLATLWHFRALMNPFLYGGFALKLLSHKLCRWLVPLSLPAAALGIGLVAREGGWALLPLGIALLGGSIGCVGILWSNRSGTPRLVRRAGYLLAANVAGVAAWIQAVTGRHPGRWEPTRRGP